MRKPSSRPRSPRAHAPWRLRAAHTSIALVSGLLLAACEGSPSSSQSATATPEPARSAPPTALPPASATAITSAAPTPADPSKAAAGSTAGAASTAAAAAKPPADIPAPSDVAAPPKDAKKTASGLASKVISPGKGKDHPKPDDRVTVNYTGWTKAGKMFDSSLTQGEPAKFGVSQVIKGWTEGLQLMVVGEKRRFWIPAALAYGERPPPGAPAGDLTFDVELLDVAPAPKPPPVPADVKAPPATATKTASGLAYRVIKPGKGGPQPKATDTVTVNYTGWTTDGKMFDSSIPTGEPVSFPLTKVIKGWTEGLQLMHVGDTVRFWIPGPLAYGDKPTRPGVPAGMLVFDVELLSIP